MYETWLPCTIGEENMLSDQPYRYLTVDEMKSLGDDSLPIDVTRDERLDSNRLAQNADYVGQQQPVNEVIGNQHKSQMYSTSATKTTLGDNYRGINGGDGTNNKRHVG